MSKNQIQPECGERTGWHGTERANLSRETKISGANWDRKKITCLVDHEQDWQPYPVDPYVTKAGSESNRLARL